MWQDFKQNITIGYKIYLQKGLLKCFQRYVSFSRRFNDVDRVFCSSSHWNEKVHKALFHNLTGCMYRMIFIVCHGSVNDYFGLRNIYSTTYFDDLPEQYQNSDMPSELKTGCLIPTTDIILNMFTAMYLTPGM